MGNDVVRTVPGTTVAGHPPAGGPTVGLLFPTGNHSEVRRGAKITYRLVMAGANGAGRARAALERIVFGAIAITTLALADAGVELTFSQWRVLVIVGETADGTTVSGIATRLGAEVSPVSRLVGRLGRRGLVVANKDDRDRRVTRVTTTTRGRDLRAAVLDRRRELLSDVLAGAGPLDADTEVALERIGAAFGRYT
jgi:DNA-binding MarR family transcriptional regulator